MPKDVYKESGRKLEISKSEQWDRILKPKAETMMDRERRKFEREAQEVQFYFLGVFFFGFKPN